VRSSTETPNVFDYFSFKTRPEPSKFTSSFLKMPRAVSAPARRWDSVGGVMRSDDRFYFFLAAAVFTVSVVYTVVWQLIPALEVNLTSAPLHHVKKCS
jgi:hypothetical protein